MNNECFSCMRQFLNQKELCMHLLEHSHQNLIPLYDGSEWSNEKYLFPTIENDPLLFDIDFGDEDDEMEVTNQ